MAAAADRASVAEIVRDPAGYDGKHVAVSGTVADLREKVSHSGNAYDVFELCEASCVRVFTWGHPTLADGQRLTVRGTFKAVTEVGSYTFRNEIEADEGSL